MSTIKSYFALITLGLVLFLPGIVNLPVIDRDEAHFAQASRQMVESNAYFQIRFQEKTRFQKPPGINWLQAGFVNVLGEQAQSRIWVYRLPSLLGAILSMCLTFAIFRQRWGRQVGFNAALLLGISLLLCIESHMAVIDTSLLSAVLLMQGALWSAIEYYQKNGRAHWGALSLFWAAMAYGFVLKGVTPLVGGLSLLTLCVLNKNLLPLRAVRFWTGFLGFVLVSLAWLLLVNDAEQSNYLLQMFKKDLLPKLKGGHESHGMPPLFHLAILPITFWPGSLFLYQAARYAFSNRHDQKIQFLLAWLVPTWVFFELMPTKLPQYVLPTFPVIAVLSALAVAEGARALKGLKTLQSLWLVLSLGLILGMVAIAYLLGQTLSVAAMLLLLGAGAGVMVVARFVFKSHYQKAILASVVLAVTTYPLFFGWVLPQLDALWLPSRIAFEAKALGVSPQKPLVAIGYGEPSLVMLTSTSSVIYIEHPDWPPALRHYPNSYVLIDTKWLPPELEPCLREVKVFKGFNYSKGKQVTLGLYENQTGNTSCPL